MLRCKIDNGMVEHIGFEGAYVEKWKCRKCKVVWTLRPEWSIDTDRGVIIDILDQQRNEYENLKEGTGISERSIFTS